jgi:hypothetical protein
MMFRCFANLHTPSAQSVPVKPAALLALASLAVLMAACAGRRSFDPATDLDPTYRVRTVPGTEFALTVVVPSAQTTAPTLWVFFEGDGRPWVAGGMRIARDPSPVNAVGFELFEASPVPRAYLGRPCYFGHSHDRGCERSLWTSARYGEAVITSMAAALRTLVRETSAGRLVLVGYSGGGTIAYLVAPRVAEVAAVVSISGNLDIDRWTRAHGYLPLSGSSNPATEPALDRRITQIAVIAGRDTNVPRSILQAFLAQQRPQEVWVYDEYDHTCCWQRNWPEIMARLRARLD